MLSPTLLKSIALGVTMSSLTLSCNGDIVKTNTSKNSISKKKKIELEKEIISPFDENGN